MQKNKCLNCGKPCHYSATYCKKCWQSGERNHCFGKHSWNYQGSVNYCCRDCGGLISKPTALKGKGRCRSCSRSGKLSWSSKIGKIHRGSNHHGWKGGLPKCIDCGKELSSYSCTRCVKCNALVKGLFGKRNPMYGKKPKFYRYKYKRITLRSSWEVLLAIWLDFSNIKWEYESKTFDLGETTYTPDFYLPEFDVWIEVKGYWRDGNKEKVKLFQEQYNLMVFEEKDLIKYLGVSRFLLQKSSKTWLEEFKIKKG